MTRRLAALALMPLAALTAGCGGDDDKGLAKADYLAASEKICKAANDESDGLKEPTGPADVVPYFDEQIGIFDAATTKLEDLAAAQPDAANLKKIFIGPLRAQVEGFRAYKPKLEAAVKEGEEALAKLEDPVPVEADLDAMKAYGFDDCVESASTE